MADFRGNEGGLGLGVGRHDYSIPHNHQLEFPIGQVAVAVGLGLVCATNAPRTLKLLALAGAGLVGVNASLVCGEKRAADEQLARAIEVANNIRRLDPRRSA